MRPRGAMLIDDFVPEYEFHERHESVVAAPRAAVRRAVEEWRPRMSLFWRLLLTARGLRRPQGTLREWAEALGFIRLADTEQEVVYGRVGRFWALRERDALAPPRTVEEFRRFDGAGCAVAAINLRLEALGQNRTRLYTETRVRTLGPQARRRFRLYWLLVRPFSGLLRRAMLNGIKSTATAYNTPIVGKPERS